MKNLYKSPITNATTSTNVISDKLSIDDLKSIADSVIPKESPKFKNGPSWFTRLMNRFGWHRKYEIIVIDKEKFKFSADLWHLRPELPPNPYEK